MLKIINAALLAQGQEVVAENDGSIEWRVCADNWPGIVEAELEDGNYHYTITEETSVLQAAGGFGYDHSYAVPVGSLYVRNVWALDAQGNRYECDWFQAGSLIYMNGDYGIVAEIVTSEEVSEWSANFSKGIQCMIEALILRSLKEEWANAREMEQAAYGYLQRARSKSSNARSKGPALKQPGGLARARFQRGA